MKTNNKLRSALVNTLCVIFTVSITPSVLAQIDNETTAKDEPGFFSKLIPFGWGKSSQKEKDIDQLKAELEAQNKKQQELLAQIGEQVLSKTINIELQASKNANAASNGQGMVTVMLYGFANGLNDLPIFEANATESILIPARTKTLSIPLDTTKTHFIAQFQLRHIKSRAQIALPLTALDLSKTLTIHIGQCDVSISSGLVNNLPEDIARYTAPLVTNCS